VRVVHGGAEFRQSVVIDWLAPQHNPAAVSLIERIREIRSDIPVVACFDTACQPAGRGRYMYPVPQAWTRRWGFRRFGFHGLSHAYVSRRAAEVLGRRPARLVSCHLGAGASLCAIKDGRSVDTTMGFTPMEGLMMATRAGSVDPGLILFALRQGLSVDEVERGPDNDSGILGVSGISSDFRVVAAAAQAGEAAADLALRIYRHRLIQGIGAWPQLWGDGRAGLHRWGGREPGSPPRGDLRGTGVPRGRPGTDQHPGAR
jgi:acetate kinase